MKTYWGVEVYLHEFLNSALDGGKWSASRPSRFTPRERAHGTYCIEGWEDPGAGLDAVVKKKIPSPCWNSNPPIIQPVAQCWSLQEITENLRRIVLIKSA
jgi:hypothetical protein